MLGHDGAQAPAEQLPGVPADHGDRDPLTGRRGMRAAPRRVPRRGRPRARIPGQVQRSNLSHGSHLAV